MHYVANYRHLNPFGDLPTLKSPPRGRWTPSLKEQQIKAGDSKKTTTVDMTIGPVQRLSPFPATIALPESYGAINNHNCVSCHSETPD